MTILFILFLYIALFYQKIGVINKDIKQIEKDNNTCRQVTNLPLIKATNNARIVLIIVKKRRKYPSYYSGFV